jgi:DNA helicase II / ATP-dependent DNA helicase PcrA
MPTDYSRKIATTTQRHVEVLASPGSGKTHTLIRRIQHLLSVGVRPEQILVLSFSNASVRELNRRMDSLRTLTAVSTTEGESEKSAGMSRISRPQATFSAQKNIAKTSASAASARHLRSSRHSGHLVENSPNSSASSASPSSSSSPASQTSAKPKLFSGVHVSTVHAFARSILPPEDRKVVSVSKALALLRKAITKTARDCGDHTLWPRLGDSQRESRAERIALLTEPQCLRQLQTLLTLARARQQTPRAVVEALATANGDQDTQNEGDEFATIYRARSALREIARRYADAKARNGLNDFDDLLVAATRRLLQHPEHVKYTHILVDEYQDSGALQSRLLASLGRDPRRSLMVFGDPHQALYGFAGSAYVPLRDVLPDGKVTTLALPVSHRLTACNAALASALAGSAIKTLDRECEREGKGITPRLVLTDSAQQQVAQTVNRIRQQIQRHKANDNDNATSIAVLARTRAQLNAIEAALRAANIRVNRLGGDHSGDKHLHLIRVLRLVHLVERAAAKKGGVDADGEGVQTLLRRWALDVDRKALTRLVGKARNALRTKSLESRYRVCRKAYAALLTKTFSADEHKAITHELGAWEPVCRQHATAKSMRDAIRGLPTDEVTSATIHAAKGGEWQHVHLLGVTDGILPIYRARTLDAIAEEQRLLYVACTRARSTLTLYHAPAQHNRSNQRFGKASRFLTTNAHRHLREIRC